MRIPAAQVADPSDALRMLWRRVTQMPQPDPQYAFFLRDLFPLLHADPVLVDIYRQRYAARRDEFVRVVERVIDAGLLRPPERPATVRDLVSLLWLVAETAQPLADVVAGELIDPRRYGRTVMQPRLTDAGRRLLGLPDPPGGAS
ncbi:TetR/AcrR family transcriptional regulator [uncultured Propionibacterium sp.]|uniref:TetR/AcrR family transcriptional regulator n=1 Tax=uncultured Propionibacterium sp. TaxID=218066 RepID=UPI00292DE189|nr:TetR/AcrR family transcriptional regulator [uncultured Propionibacterium sp.]